MRESYYRNREREGFLREEKRALLVDSDERGRGRVWSLLERYPQIRVMGEAGSFEGWKKKGKFGEPDLIFFGLRGEEMGEIDREMGGVIICVSDGERHAVKAFEIGAVDYLVEPIAEERFEKAVGRVLGGEGGERGAGEGTVFLKSGGGMRAVEVSEITHLVADDHFTKVYTGGEGSVHSGHSLKDWERRLPAGDFVRLGRSLMVNRKRVVAFVRGSRDEGFLTVEGSGEPIPVGRAAMQSLRKHFHLNQ